MIEFLLNVLTLLRKEALMILKDKRGRIVLIMPLIVQTVIFGHVATYDLNNVEYALLGRRSFMVFTGNWWNSSMVPPFSIGS